MWPFKKKVVQEVSSKRMESITKYEGTLIAAGTCAKCPDCGGYLLQGPEGGMSINTLCEGCGSEFNLTFWGGLIIGERISDRGPRDPGHRACVYGNSKIRLDQ